MNFFQKLSMTPKANSKSWSNISDGAFSEVATDYRGDFIILLNIFYGAPDFLQTMINLTNAMKIFVFLGIFVVKKSFLIDVFTNCYVKNCLRFTLTVSGCKGNFPKVLRSRRSKGEVQGSMGPEAQGVQRILRYWVSQGCRRSLGSSGCQRSRGPGGLRSGSHIFIMPSGDLARPRISGLGPIFLPFC